MDLAGILNMILILVEMSIEMHDLTELETMAEAEVETEAETCAKAETD